MAKYVSEPTWDCLRESLHYAPATGKWTNLVWRGGSAKAGTEAGTIWRRTGPSGLAEERRVIRFAGRIYYSSRLAWFYMTGSWPTADVDHRDGNSLNDAWENLRLNNKQEAVRHRGTFRKKSDFPKGVSRATSGNTVQVAIRVNRKLVHLAVYPNDAEGIALASAIYEATAERKYEAFYRKPPNDNPSHTIPDEARAFLGSYGVAVVDSKTREPRADEPDADALEHP